jgi:hypothetical protein
MPQAKKTQAKKTQAKKTQAKKTQPKKPRKSSASSESSAVTLLDTLTRGIFLTRERISDTLEDAVRRGRITRDDAEELTASLVGLGRRQAQEIVSELESVLGRGRRRTAERTDAIVRRVDRVRRTAGVGPTFPILGYDDLTAAQVADRLSDLTPAQLRKVRDHERRNANRKSVLTAIERALR